MEFYKCSTCGNIITHMESKGPVVFCCGKKMEKLEPGVVEASHEKHIPVVKIEGDQVTVEVGSAVHPMVPEHYIEWIVLETAAGAQWKKLAPTDAPSAVFTLAGGDTVKAAWAYCNIHGLWKQDL